MTAVIGWYGRLTRCKSPTLYTNDLAGRLISQTDPVQRTTTFGYDADGRKLVLYQCGQ